jgi:hypothetical protein
MSPPSFVLWSGAGQQEVATAFTGVENAITIAGTEAGQAAATGAMSWYNASAAFANSASGTVYTFLNSPTPTSIFNTVELPILQNNNVTNIVNNPLFPLPFTVIPLPGLWP